MSELTLTPSDQFVDRRKPRPDGSVLQGERRQFTNSHDELTPAARELAQAVDEYKLHHRRRFITYEEMLNIVTGLGYGKSGY